MINNEDFVYTPSLYPELFRRSGKHSDDHAEWLCPQFGGVVIFTDNRRGRVIGCYDNRYLVQIVDDAGEILDEFEVEHGSTDIETIEVDA